MRGAYDPGTMTPEFEEDWFAEEPAEPPFIDVKRLDFSQFHATGDHWPFTAYCRSQYGGSWHHLVLAWEFRWRDTLLAPWHWLQCRRGHHSVIEGWRRDTPNEPMKPYRMCVHCGTPLT